MLRPCRTTCIATRIPFCMSSPNHCSAAAVALVVTFYHYFSSLKSEENKLPPQCYGTALEGRLCLHLVTSHQPAGGLWHLNDNKI